LIEQGCDLAAINNDGELALDITENELMESLLQKHMDKAGLYLCICTYMNIRKMFEICCVKLLIIDFQIRLEKI